MGEEDGVEILDQEGCRSLWEMLQGPVRNIVWSRSLADFETPDGFLNLFRVDYLLFAGRGHEVRPQRHFNYLNNYQDRRIGHRLKLSLQIVGKGLGFLRVSESDSPGVTRGRESRNSHHPFGHPPQ